MKSASFFMLSILLVVAIMAPSVITLLDIDSKTELIMEFKEAKVKDFFPSSQVDMLSYLGDFFSNNNTYYLEKKYLFSTSIFLPPPEGIL